CLDIFRSIRIFGISQDIGDLDRTAFERGASRSAVATGTCWILPHELDELLRGIVCDRHPQQFPIETVDYRPVSSAQPDRAFRNGFKHRLKIECRAADDLKNL